MVPRNILEFFPWRWGKCVLGCSRMVPRIILEVFPGGGVNAFEDAPGWSQGSSWIFFLAVAQMHLRMLQDGPKDHPGVFPWWWHKCV